MMRILMTGASGNTGSKVLRKLLNGNQVSEVVALTNERSIDEDLANDPRVISVKANLNEPGTWLGHVTPDIVFVETANLRFGDRMIPHLAHSGVRRAFCVTTTGVFSSHHSYSQMYREIEQRYRESPIEITLMRPSMIYGNNRDHNMHRLISLIQKTPIFPLFGGGGYLMQPVHVDDLAWGIARTITTDTRGEYNLAGPRPLTYREIVEIIAEEVDSKTFMLPVPHRAAAAIVKVLQRIPGFPVTHEQVMRLVEDKAFNIESAQSKLGYAPVDFRVGVRRQLEVAAAEKAK